MDVNSPPFLYLVYYIFQNQIYQNVRSSPTSTRSSAVWETWVGEKKSLENSPELTPGGHNTHPVPANGRSLHLSAESLWLVCTGTDAEIQVFNLDLVRIDINLQAEELTES